jgi:hypothetical protein
MKSIIYVDGKSSPAIFDSNNESLRIISEKEIDSLPDAIFEELETLDLLEFLEDDEVLTKVLGKLRHGGKIKISGNDAIQVLSAASSGACSLDEASNLILNGRKRLISVHDLKKKLTSFGLNVTLVGIVGSRYTLEAQRQ